MEDIYVLIETLGTHDSTQRNVRGYVNKDEADEIARLLNDLAKKGTTNALREKLDAVGDYTEASFKAARASIVRQMNLLVNDVQDTGFHLSETTYSVEPLNVEGYYS